MKVKDVLSKKSSTVVTITADQTLLEASHLLAEYNIGAVMVVDEDGASLGILSERDIVRKMAMLKADVVDLKVAEAMTEDVITALPDDDLSHVSSVMTEKRIRHLPIMDGRKLIGIVSIGDVVKAQLDHVENEAHMLRQYIVQG